MTDNERENLQRKLGNQPGIIGRDEYFNAGVLVLLIYFGDEYHFVLQKRSANIRQGGEISFPGGKYDPEQDQNLKDTAFRETEEEMGIPREKIQYMGQMDTLITPMGVLIEPFVGIAKINNPKDMRINPYEVEEAFTVPVSYFEKSIPSQYELRVQIHPSEANEQGEEHILFPAKELGIPEMYTKPWGRRNYKVYAYQVEQGTIWGITARLIHEIIERIK